MSQHVGATTIPPIQAIVGMLSGTQKSTLSSEDFITLIALWRWVGQMLKGPGYLSKGQVVIWSEPHAMASVHDPLSALLSSIQDLRNEFVEGGKGKWQTPFANAEIAMQNLVVEFRRSLRNQDPALDKAFRKMLTERF
jgi:hypothetical protein